MMIGGHWARRASAAGAFLGAALVIVAPPARAETVYEFAIDCNKVQLPACIDHIRERLDVIKAKEQGRAFCLPRAWGSPGYIKSGYPISVLEHVRISVSAARFGKSEMPVEDAMRDILAQIYPCD